MAPGLLVYSFPAEDTGSLGLRHRVTFSRINIPDNLSGLWPGLGARTELDSTVDCFMVGGPGLLTPGPQLLLQGPVSLTGQLWPGPVGMRSGAKGLAEANFLVLGPVYLPEEWKPRWELHPHH